MGEIAREKAGIIRRGGVVVTLPQQPEANDVIGNAILELEARAVNAVPYVPPVSPGSSAYLVAGSEARPGDAESWAGASGQRDFTAKSSKEAAKGAEQFLYRYPLSVLGKQILVETSLVGRHQLRNVALAIAAAGELAAGIHRITAETIERGIRETRWPGRFQVIAARAGWPEIVLDVAHNPAGAWALRSALSERYPDRPLLFVFGAMRDKAIGEMTEIIFPLAERVIATQPENPRSAPPEEIQQAGARTGAEIETASAVASALERAKALAATGTPIVITGSIYLVGEAMRLLDVRV